MVEKKAKAFYNENYHEKKEKKLGKNINVVIFTNKAKNEISRKSSLNNLTKTTIKNHSNTNRSSTSLITIEKIFNEINIKNKVKIDNDSKNNLTNNNIDLNKKPKNIFLLQNISKKGIPERQKDFENRNLITKMKNITMGNNNSSDKRLKIKRKISKKVQENLMGKMPYSNGAQKMKIIQQKISSNLKNNSKKNVYKQIYTQSKEKKMYSESKINSKITLSESNNQKEKVNNPNNNINVNNNIYKQDCYTITNDFNSKKKNLISNLNSNFHKGNLKVCSINNLNKNKNNTNLNYNFHKAISTIKNNSKLRKKTLKVIQKANIQKNKKINQTKSRNYKLIFTENNNNNTTSNKLFSTQTNNDLILRSINTDNITDYYTTFNNKELNTLSIRKSNQILKPKMKLIKPVNNINKKEKINQSNNRKVFNFIKANPKNNTILSSINLNKLNGSSSSSLASLNIKNKKVSANIRKAKVIEKKNNLKINTNSYILHDSQKIIKNLKGGNNYEINILNDNKVKRVLNNNNIKIKGIKENYNTLKNKK